MKNKENKENGRSECDLSVLHTDVFTYTPQADGLLTYLLKSKRSDPCQNSIHYKYLVHLLTHHSNQLVLKLYFFHYLASVFYFSQLW